MWQPLFTLCQYQLVKAAILNPFLQVATLRREKQKMDSKWPPQQFISFAKRKKEAARFTYTVTASEISDILRWSTYNSP